ncbi:hypothetical protein [uncultured Mitsuokella sp.]|uniref:hypothetical protein n=1 Tax=uncultured Mitsuokella sp. TaxID=453120 RepID=UPI0026DD3109|nr:hypothetical protein [uncultured Mitsuokella sp.]
MRKLFSFLCMLVMLTAFCGVAGAAERQPLKVAQFPLIVQSSWLEPGLEVTDDLERQIDRALHVPLNGTLHRVEYLPEKDCLAAWDEAADESRSRKVKDRAKVMADKLGADLVVIPIVNDYVQYTTMSWHWDRDIILHSYVSLELVVYDRATDKVVDKKASRFYDDDYSTTGTASYLAREAMTDLIQQVNLRGYIWARPDADSKADESGDKQASAGDGQTTVKK